jgi:hypothetical protein
MGLARSTYYAEPASQPIEEARLVERIKEICAEWPSYGDRRVMAQLRAEGSVVNHKKVMRLMRKESDATGSMQTAAAEPKNRGQSKIGGIVLASGITCLDWRWATAPVWLFMRAG